MQQHRIQQNFEDYFPSFAPQINPHPSQKSHRSFNTFLRDIYTWKHKQAMRKEITRSKITESQKDIFTHRPKINPKSVLLAQRKQVSENVKFLHIQHTLASLQKSQEVLDSHETYQTFNKSHRSNKRDSSASPLDTETSRDYHPSTI